MTNYELKRRLAGNIISAEDTLAQMRHTFEMLPDMPTFFTDKGRYIDTLDSGKFPLATGCFAVVKNRTVVTIE